MLGGARLQEVNLNYAILTGADLTGADLSGAQLHHTQADAAIFRRANFSGASLRDGRFSSVLFDGANLTDANLQHALCYTTTWKGARLRRTIISSSRDGYPPEIDLSMSTGLSQQQISEAIGDTGVSLPKELFHPISWPAWVKAESKHDPDEGNETSSPPHAKFVFLSHASQDQAISSLLSEALTQSNIAVWWDKDIAPGASWRDTISERLDSAAVILTLWTENSVNSKAVCEEAAHAQRTGKFLHVRMDKSVLPYGFSETQYVDLQNWTGDLADPRLQNLVQGIRDKFNPPSREELEQRLRLAAPIAATIEGGLVTAKDTPLEAKPPINDETDLKARLSAQEVLAQKILDATEVLDNNLGEAIRFDLRHLLAQLRSPSSITWYTLSDAMSDVAAHLENEDINWPGTTLNSLRRLCSAHDAIRPLMQPVQPPANHPSAPLPPPAVVTEELRADALGSAVRLAQETFASAEASTVLTDSAIGIAEYLAVEIDQARVVSSPDVMAPHRRLAKLQRALTGLTGLVGTAITTMSYGISVNLLTTPDAAKVLLTTLKKLYDILISFF